MPARANYSGYFEAGSAARKREYIEVPNIKSRPVTGKAKAQKTKVAKNVQKRTKLNYSLVTFTFTAFIMTMVITYRFNIINEKNLQVLTLKDKLASAEAALLKAQMEVESQTDLNKVEAYAKQQLGMQKPDKNQTVYIDTSKVSNSVYTNQDTTMLNKVIDKAKTFLINIF